MKSFYLTAAVLFTFLVSFSAPVNKVIVHKGKWNNSRTWSLGRTPVSGDTVLVPKDFSLVVDNNVKMTAENIYVKVIGNIRFEVGKLDIGYNSIVELVKDATITTKQGNPSDKIELGGFLKYSGSQGTVTGPIILSNAPVVTLPVKFIGYAVSRSNKGTAIEWSTSEEVNANMYVVERSEDGSNWNAIAYVAAVGNSTEVNNYSFTDKKPVEKTTYYRVQQVDNDGHFVYTAIKSVKLAAEQTMDVKISTAASQVVVALNKEMKGNIVVRIVSLSGQVVAQKIITKTSGLILLDKASLKGNYVVSITNGTDVKIAKQVIL